MIACTTDRYIYLVIQNNAFYHPGVRSQIDSREYSRPELFLLQYFSVYMSPASPAANSPTAGTGKTWFKIWEDPPVFENGALVFPSQSKYPSGSSALHYLTPLTTLSDRFVHLHDPEDPPKWPVPYQG